MFVIFNKERSISYLVSLSTVTILFFMSFLITNKNDSIVKTSTSNVYQDNEYLMSNNTIIEK